MASDISCAFYDLDELQRPHTLFEFDRWALQTARLLVSREQRHRGRERLASDLVKNSGLDRGDADSEEIVDRLYALYHHVQPTQENHVYLRDVLRHFAKVPRKMQLSLLRLAKAENVVAYAEDVGCDIYEAMNEQRKLHDVFRRLMDDDADEKRLSTGA